MIRRAAAGDVDAVAALFRRSFGTLDFLPTLHTPEEDRQFLGRVIAEQDVWVAERERTILGFLSLDGNLGTFFYVDPQEHGAGVGSALFDQAQKARPHGFEFWVFQRNHKARRFYERHGCRAVRFTDGSANEEQEPDVLYEWRPATPAPSPAAEGRGSSGR
jgi:GNAT superfamily N-acetyltransferase